MKQRGTKIVKTAQIANYTHTFFHVPQFKKTPTVADAATIIKSNQTPVATKQCLEGYINQDN